MSKVEITFLGQQDIMAAGALEMQDVIEVLEEVYARHGFGDYVMPHGAVVRFGGAESEKTSGRMIAAPGYIGGKAAIAGVHWAATLPQNPARFRLPRSAGLIVLSDPVTGLPVAVMDDALVTCVRAGAHTGLAAKYLARSDCRVIGLIGVGDEAWTQLLALQSVLPSAEQVVLYDPDRTRAEALMAEVSGKLRWDVQVARSVEEAARSADVLVTAADWEQPVVEASWLKAGTLCYQSGDYGFGLDVAHQCDKIIVDDWDEMKHQGLHDLTRLHRQGLLPEDRIDATLGEVVTGHKGGRNSDRDVILCGHAVLPMADLGIAIRIIRNARARGIGSQLTLR